MDFNFHYNQSSSTPAAASSSSSSRRRSLAPSTSTSSTSTTMLWLALAFVAVLSHHHFGSFLDVGIPSVVLVDGWSFNHAAAPSFYTFSHNRRRTTHDRPSLSSPMLYSSSLSEQDSSSATNQKITVSKFETAEEELKEIIATKQRQEEVQSSTLQQTPQEQQVLYYDEDEEHQHLEGPEQRHIVAGLTANNEECVVSFDVPAQPTIPPLPIPPPPPQEIDLHGLEELAPLERQMLRMEGLEPYVLVSVLSSTTSYGTITGTAILKNGAIDLLSTLLLATSTVSTVCGVYSTVVFSMCILYGKTALGLDKEDAYYYFMEATSLQRFRGFKAFSYSLLLFVIDIFLIGVDKMPDEYQIVGGLAALSVTVFGYFEFDTILEGAAPMFTGVIPGQDTPDDTEKK